MEEKQELSPEQIEKFQEELQVKGLLSPQKRRILNLEDDLLLQHYGLIAHKGSSLSSQERKMVMERVAYGIKSKRFDMDKVTESVNNVTTAIENELNRQLKQDGNSKA